MVCILCAQDLQRNVAFLLEVTSGIALHFVVIFQVLKSGRNILGKL